MSSCLAITVSCDPRSRVLWLRKQGWKFLCLSDLLSGSKTQRFLEAQPYIAGKKVSIQYDAKHLELVKKHLKDITANNAHRHDDIADTFADAVKIGLIDKLIGLPTLADAQQSHIMSNMAQAFRKKSQAKGIVNHGAR